MISLAIEDNPHIGLGFQSSGRKGYPTINPIVGETNDGYLSDQQSRPINLEEVRNAIHTASQEQILEGAVGAGTGTTCYGWKGGIGTASRQLSDNFGGYTVGTLVQSNFGRPEELVIQGVPVGRFLKPPNYRIASAEGSIMTIVATDAPLDSRQLERLCHRVAFGLARTGSTCHGGSGDFVIAFSTSLLIPDRAAIIQDERPFLLKEQQIIGQLGLAVIEGVEEAIYNSMLMATTIVGRDDHVRHQIPASEVKAIIESYKWT